MTCVRDLSTTVLVLTVAAGGCNADVRDDAASFGGGDGPLGATDSGTDGAGAEGSGAASTGGGSGEAEDDTVGVVDEGSEDGTKLDVASGETGLPGACVEGDDCGCTAVDVLFVVDNSGSMCFYQEQLAEAFPDFVDAMFDALPSGTDLHVGVVTSGFALGGSHSEVNCEAAETPAMIDEFYVRPGEGLVDGNGLQGRLLQWDGQPYFAADTGADADRAALSEWFSGAATSVGCGVSSFEFNASGAAWALHPDNAGTNAGFVRDEGAVLVMFILSDEVDQSLDVESLDFLHDTVVEAKAGCGGESCIVTGGLLSPWCTGVDNASAQFLDSFGDAPTVGSIGDPFSTPDYGMVVGDTFAQVVAQTCDEIEPEG